MNGWASYTRKYSCVWHGIQQNFFILIVFIVFRGSTACASFEFGSRCFVVVVARRTLKGPACFAYAINSRESIWDLPYSAVRDFSDYEFLTVCVLRIWWQILIAVNIHNREIFGERHFVIDVMYTQKAETMSYTTFDHKYLIFRVRYSIFGIRDTMFDIRYSVS